MNNNPLLITLAIIIATCMLVSGYLVSIEPNLNSIELVNYKIHCSTEVRAGKRYMWIKDEEGNIYDSLSRVAGCEDLTNLNAKALIVFLEVNLTIYGLDVGGRKIISIEDSLKGNLNIVIFLEICLFIILLSLLNGIFRLKKNEPENPVNPEDKENLEEP